MPLSPRLFLSLCIEDSRSTHPVPSGSGWVQGPRREETRSLFPCALPTEHHPQRSSNPKLRRHRRRRRWGQGRLRDSAWAPAERSPYPGCVFSLPQRRKRLTEGKRLVKVTQRGSRSRESNPRLSDPRASGNCLPGGEAESRQHSSDREMVREAKRR